MADHPTPDSPRVALVLGASRGLGAALAEALGAAGWQVVAVARTTGALEELDDRIRRAGGLPATLAPMDITNLDAMRTLCRGIHDRWGRADLWVHAAIHAPPLSPAHHIAQKDWERSLATNAEATGLLIPLIEPLLRAAGPAVARDTAQDTAQDTAPGATAPASPTGTALFFDDPQGTERFHAAYGASKAAQMTLARAWAAEAAKLGPRVLIETPPPMPTALRARFRPGENRASLTPCARVAADILARLRAAEAA